MFRLDMAIINKKKERASATTIRSRYVVLV